MNHLWKLLAMPVPEYFSNSRLYSIFSLTAVLTCWSLLTAHIMPYNMINTWGSWQDPLVSFLTAFEFLRTVWFVTCMAQASQMISSALLGTSRCYWNAALVGPHWKLPDIRTRPRVYSIEDYSHQAQGTLKSEECLWRHSTVFQMNHPC